VKRAIEIHGDKEIPYIWCDAGCVRIDSTCPVIRTFGQNISRIPQNKLLLQTLHNRTQEINTKIFYKSPDAYIAGAIIAGYPDVWQKCSELYDETIVKYVDASISCNSDQYVWATTRYYNKDMFECVAPHYDYKGVDVWFHFLAYLSNV
jgi:hypothetical protein